MIFDADDFVSRRIAAFVNSRTGSAGWFVADGWMYSGRRKVFRHLENFNRRCGTCLMVPYEAYAVPDDLDIDATQEQVAEAFGQRLQRIMGAHRDALDWYADHGRLLEELPFRGAVYHVDTGENHSGKSMQGLARPSTTALRREFTVPDESGLLVSLLRSVAIGSPAAVVGAAVRRLRGLARRLGLAN
jgi:hypothetical protein